MPDHLILLQTMEIRTKLNPIEVERPHGIRFFLNVTPIRSSI